MLSWMSPPDAKQYYQHIRRFHMQRTYLWSFKIPVTPSVKSPESSLPTTPASMGNDTHCPLGKTQVSLGIYKHLYRPPSSEPKVTSGKALFAALPPAGEICHSCGGVYIPNTPSHLWKAWPQKWIDFNWALEAVHLFLAIIFGVTEIKPSEN